MLIQFLITFITIFIKLLYWAVFIHVIMSWVASGKSSFGELLDRIVQPIIKPFRWAKVGMIDFSPLIALLVLGYVERVAGKYLMQFLS